VLKRSSRTPVVRTLNKGGKKRMSTGVESHGVPGGGKKIGGEKKKTKKESFNTVRQGFKADWYAGSRGDQRG